MLGYIITPKCRARFPELARAYDRLDAEDPVFDYLPHRDRRDLRRLFAELKRQRVEERLNRERKTAA